MSYCTRRIPYCTGSKDALTKFIGYQNTNVYTKIIQWMSKMYKHNSMEDKDVLT